MTASSSYRVLVIDDTPAIHEDFRKVFPKSDSAPNVVDDAAAALFGAVTTFVPDQVEFLIDSAYQGREGALALRAALEAGRPYALAFVDMRMPPGWDGLETIQELWQIDPRLQVVICTAHSDRSWHDIRTVLGPSDSLIILKKPFDQSEARQLAHALGRKWTLARDNELRIVQLDALIRERTQELRVAEDRFSRAFAANPHAQALVALDPFEILEINAAFTQQFALTLDSSRNQAPEMLGRLMGGARWRELLVRLRQDEAINEHAFQYEPSPGNIRELRCSASPLRIDERPCSIWLLRDVTEQHRLEKQALQSQKMEAVGQLAAGIAHDFNNLLTVIQGYNSMAMEDNNQGVARTALGLTRVQEAVHRASLLTRQLLLFSRNEAAAPEAIDLAKSFEGIREMLTRLVPERIELVWNSDAALPLVLANCAHLEQVVMNLVINARDATPAHGSITVAIKTAHIEAAELSRHPRARVGTFVTLAVSDTGTGISPETMGRIFEPFFTTKESGKGTGLGLFTVYGITERHGGWIEVASSLGQGTTFTVYLPAHSVIPSPRPAATLADSDAFQQRGRGERILVVEDDQHVRSAIMAIITRAGYHVTAAHDGVSALQAWREAKGDFDLVFTDLVMPNGVSGFDLAERLRQDRPKIKLLFTTGYTDQPQYLGIRGTDAVLLKPYATADLVARLRSTLDADDPTLLPTVSAKP